MSCKTVTMSRYRLPSMPKVELHRHLAGSISPGTLLQAKLRFDVPLPAVTEDKIRELAVLERPMDNLQEVLSRFALFAGICTSPEVVEFIAHQAVVDAAADGVCYLELRFSPGFMAFRHGLALEAVIEAVVNGSQRAAREAGILVPLIAIASREMGPEVCLNTFRLAARYTPFIVGVDLAGDEDNYPPQPFAPAFQFAHEQGLGITVHAGEQSCAENIRTAVELLHARRIGHGIQAVHHAEIMALLRERHIPLEISITSNWIVGAVSTVEAHPVCQLQAAGVPVTINSDDPALFGIDLTGELELYARICDLGPGDLLQRQVEALEFGFAPESDKAVVRQRLHDWWSNA